MNIREALEAIDFEVKDGSSDEEIRVCCPFCMEEGESDLDDRFRLGINIRTGRANCFNCGKKSHGGNYILEELIRILDTGGMELSLREQRKKKIKFDGKLPEGFKLVVKGTKAYSYLRSRGVTRQQIKDKGIGYTEIGKYRFRVIFPIYRKKRLKGFVGRDYTDTNDLPYLNSKGIKAIGNLPDKTKNKIVCFSEGMFDAIAIERGAIELGIDSGALLGHVLKDDQFKYIKRYSIWIVWPDPDAPGIKGLFKIAEKIPKGVKLKVILPDSFLKDSAPDKDPSDLRRKERVLRLKNAVRYTESLKNKLRLWLSFEE